MSALYLLHYLPQRLQLMLRYVAFEMLHERLHGEQQARLVQNMPHGQLAAGALSSANSTRRCCTMPAPYLLIQTI
jgi:hypothetical protein